MDPTLGILEMRNAVLRRIHDHLPGDHKATLAVACTLPQWRALVKEHFHLPLTDLTDDELAGLWMVVQAKHAEWRWAQRLERWRPAAALVATAAVVVGLGLGCARLARVRRV